MQLNNLNINYVPFPHDQYYHEVQEKKQLVIHHTVSGEGVDGDKNWWLKTPARIATAFIIARDGIIHQNFSSKYWGHHLGIQSHVFKKYRINSEGQNRLLNEQSIGIELDSWGGLTDLNKVSDYTTYKNEYRGFKHFETYTKAQLSSLRDLLIYLSGKYNIPTKYNEDMWDVSKKALKGTPGIWSHTSFRKDKSDCHPQPELIEILKTC